MADGGAERGDAHATPACGIEVEGAADVWVRLSKCCAPVPGDEIKGFVSHGHGVSVHRANCVNLRL
jgi:GTP diphosphokinase / guanosine-3',5'-bis(diphosphate) 3'-diphosphatase